MDNSKFQKEREIMHNEKQFHKAIRFYTYIMHKTSQSTQKLYANII